MIDENNKICELKDKITELRSDIANRKKDSNWLMALVCERNHLQAKVTELENKNIIKEFLSQEFVLKKRTKTDPSEYQKGVNDLMFAIMAKAEELEQGK